MVTVWPSLLAPESIIKSTLEQPPAPVGGLKTKTNDRLRDFMAYFAS